MPAWPRVRVIALALLLTLLTTATAFAAAVIATPLPTPHAPATTEVLDKHGHVIARLSTKNRIEIPVMEMPESLLNAIVAIEDDRFYLHRGIDVIGIARAFTRNLAAGHVVQGGSTLTQQLARNLYLTQQRTLGRKVREAVLAAKLELTYSKKELLGMYWNIIYLGHGNYGVEVAAQSYFGKSARELTLTESALMAALPQAPEYYSQPENAPVLTGRRNIVLDRMAHMGFITTEQATAAKTEPVALRAEAVRTATVANAPVFVDHYIN